MNKKMLSGLLLALLILLIGCNPFTTNLYSSFDKFENPDLSDPKALLDVADEPQFYENLKDDPKAKAEVLETLQEFLEDEDTSKEEKQEAALMIVDVHLKTSDTDDTMSNLNELVGDAVDGDVDFAEGDDGPEVFFRQLFGEPPSSASKKEDYKESVIIQLEAFLAAAEPLQIYGETLETTKSSPPGTNDGDNATKALMAGMTRTLVYYIDASTEDARVDILAEYLSTPKDDDGNVPYEINYVGDEMDDVENPTEMLVDPADPDNPDKDGLKEVVSFGGIDLDDLF